MNSDRVDERQREVLKKEALLRLYRYLFAYKKEIVIVLGIMAVAIAINLSAPLLMEYAINVCAAGRDVLGFLKPDAGAMVLFIIFLIGTRARMYMMTDVSNRALVTIQEELYEHIRTLSFHLFDSRSTGKILAHTIRDVNSLKDVLSDSMTQLIPDMLTVFYVAVIMVVKDYKLVIAVPLTLPLLLPGMLFIEVRTHQRWQVYQKRTSSLNTYVHGNLSGIKIVQSFAAEPGTRQEFAQLTKEHRRAFLDTVCLADGFGSVVEITWRLGGFLLYYTRTEIAGMEEIGTDTFLAFSTCIAMFWSPIRNLTDFYNRLVTSISGTERIFDIMDTKMDIVDRDGASELPDIQGEMTFEHVSFAYQDEPGRVILEDVDFRTRPGETIALVGPAGAGKTTIVNLISRFYDVTAGRVMINGYDVQDVTVKGLRRQMGIMTRDNFLFSRTIREDIKYGRLDATDEEMIATAKTVDARKFIMNLEHGHDTQISERGARLSTGQRQLLAFARTVVSSPRVSILDGATSSIDTRTELLVQRGIAAMLEGRTPLVIAHRFSTIRRVDHVFVIDNGNVMETGTHEMPVEQKGAYY